MRWMTKIARTRLAMQALLTSVPEALSAFAAGHDLQKSRHENGNHPDLATERKLQLPYLRDREQQDVEIRRHAEDGLEDRDLVVLDAKGARGGTFCGAKEFQSDGDGGKGKVEDDLDRHGTIYQELHSPTDGEYTEVEQQDGQFHAKDDWVVDDGFGKKHLVRVPP